MRAFHVYLNFDGTTRDAMTFYAKALDAQLVIQTFGDAGVPGPPGSENRVMHATITKGSSVIMASDTMPGMEFRQGNNFHISIDCESKEELQRYFSALGEGGKVTMPPADQFWGAHFGMLTDRFGIGWMFNYQFTQH
jgi:PhnB protein